MTEKISFKEKKDLDLFDILSIFWDGKRWIFFITILFVLIGIYYLRSAEYVYEVSLDVTPVHTNSESKGANIPGLRSAMLNLGFDQSADNREFEVEGDSIIDFTETNPFGDPSETF